jgi:hypothetical protein
MFTRLCMRIPRDGGVEIAGARASTMVKHRLWITTSPECPTFRWIQNIHQRQIDPKVTRLSCQKVLAAMEVSFLDPGADLSVAPVVSKSASRSRFVLGITSFGLHMHLISGSTSIHHSPRHTFSSGYSSLWVCFTWGDGHPLHVKLSQRTFPFPSDKADTRLWRPILSSLLLLISSYSNLCGFSEYLGHFVSSIDAPQLKEFSISTFSTHHNSVAHRSSKQLMEHVWSLMTSSLGSHGHHGHFDTEICVQIL